MWTYYLYKSNYFIGKGGLNMLDEVNTIVNLNCTIKSV